MPYSHPLGNGLNWGSAYGTLGNKRHNVEYIDVRSHQQNLYCYKLPCPSPIKAAYANHGGLHANITILGLEHLESEANQLRAVDDTIIRRGSLTGQRFN